VVAEHESDLAGVACALVGVIELLAEEVARAFAVEEMLGNLVDLDFFGRADGLMLFAKGIEKLLDFLVVFVGHLGDGCAESVTECVLADFGLAVVGAGSGGGLRVAAVGLDLGFGSHFG
jgi:hypothetical protein